MKITFQNIVPAIIFFLTAPALAQTWHADPISGCTVLDDDESDAAVLISWSGECDENNRAQGYGVLSWFEDGKLVGRYDGSMLGGKASGQGIMYVAATGSRAFSKTMRSMDNCGPGRRTA